MGHPVRGPDPRSGFGSGSGISGSEGSKNPDSGISGPPDFQGFRGFGPFLDQFWTSSGPVLDDLVTGVRR